MDTLDLTKTMRVKLRVAVEAAQRETGKAPPAAAAVRKPTTDTPITPSPCALVALLAVPHASFADPGLASDEACV